MGSPLRIGNLELRADGIAEYEGKRSVVFIHVADVERIRSAYTFTAERPVAAAMTGGAALAAGAYLAYPVVATLDHVGFARSRATMLMITVMLLMLGFLLLRVAFRRGACVVVQTPAGRRVLAAGRKISRDDLESWLAAGATQYAYVRAATV